MKTKKERVVEFWNGKHPLFPGQKRISRARRVLAERLGRSLRQNEYAHHKDENTLNDTKSNVVRKFPVQHNRLHFLGKKLSNEHKEKISTNNLGKHNKPKSLECRRKISESKKGKAGHLCSLETREKIRQKVTGLKRSEETKQKISQAKKGTNHLLGYSLSEETKRKISESRKHYEEFRKSHNLKRTISDEHKCKIGQSKIGNKYFLGHKHSDETKRKMSEGQRRYREINKCQ